MKHVNRLDKKAVRQGFNRAAPTYDQAAVLQREIANRLLERLQWFKINPRVILDLGAGTGSSTQRLAELYPQADIIAVDIAEQMLLQSRNKTHHRSWLQKLGFLRSKQHPIDYLCADAEALPFKAASIDLIFSNLSIQWVNDYLNLFSGLLPILKPSGCLLFSTFGVDTLNELKQSWQGVSQGVHVNDFTDLHDLGDFMLQSGFIDPVMDCERLLMEYHQLPHLLQDLKHIGAQNHIRDRSKGLMTRAKLNAMYQNYEQFKLPNGKYPATYEVVYGHAWGRDLSLNRQKIHAADVTEQVIQFSKPIKRST